MKPTDRQLFDSRNSVWLDLGLLIARFGFGGTLILRHGLAKIPALLASPIQFFDPLGLGAGPSLGLAIFAEVVCALALIVGYRSRLACLPLIVNFAVIVLVIHRLQVPGNRGELALLYLVAFLVLCLTGPGRYSLDYWLGARSHRSSVDSSPP